MLMHAFKYSWILLLAVCAFFVSCNDDTNDLTEETIEEFADNAVYTLQASGSLGRQGCFELVFPISIEFEDGTVSVVNSYEELRDLIIAWKEANPDFDQRPQFVFPIEVISEEGDLITVNNKEELKALKEECDRPFRPGKHRPGDCGLCFKIIFPINIEFPDGTVEEVTSRLDLKQTLREWKLQNPDVDERPHIVFPITVEMDDGTIVTVNSKEELIALKESCD